MKDVKQLGLFAAIASLSYVFWMVGGMEMIERFAYYGVKAVATLYAKDAASNGGLGITLSDFGIIMGTWALMQSLLPIFVGGLADRYGYKETIFVSTVVKIVGYLVMAWYPTFWGFFGGAMLLATGTAIFKPGIQGTLVHSTNRQNSSMAWGIFYQTVNIGGWMGPLLAGFLRENLSWQSVFFACAGIISINFILLLLYKEPNKAERLERNRKIKAGELKQDHLVIASIKELKKPQLWAFLLVMSGFWFMFNSFFDVLPAHIDDWVDTGIIVQFLFGTDGTDSRLVQYLLAMTNDGLTIKPEGLINLNAGMIMIFCFAIGGWLSGKMKALTSMIVGTVLGSVALAWMGHSNWAWVFVFGILLFSTAEMLSSPKFLEYLGNIAPRDNKAMYLGFSQMSLAVGWTLEGYIGPWLYDVFASKDRFSRELLAERGMDGSAILEIPQGEAFTRLVEFTGESAQSLTAIMYEAHNIGYVWYIMAVVGVISAVGIYAYGRWMLSLRSRVG